MKIVIVGPGAVGSLLASLLTKSRKEEIWLLDYNKERSKKLNESGISVEGLATHNTKVKVTHNIQDIGKSELVIICVKSYDTKEAITACKTIISDETSILTLQNGLGNIETITEITNSENVIGGVTNLGSTLLEPGKVRYAGKGETVIGRIDGKITVGMKRAREIFNASGLETKISKDIKGILWSKLIINVGINALTAITRLHNGKLVEFEGTRKILREAVTEAVRISKRKRIKLLYDDPLAKVESVCEATAANISSMLQDILRKKRTEIDFINGAIVRQAQELGIPAPVNQILVDLVKTIESGYKFTLSG